ncbi:MAG: UDP-N-acetylglucosamine 1-carboxyvinyltransferase [Hyphomonadaceae bacterium]|nr:UDP-N-acetylglucosamine 1-carboxyvinyltransferase [Clostridia bacterium]
MEKLLIHGGIPLNGEVTVSGAKNAVIAVLPAAALVEGVCRIENVPHIKDVDIILDILKQLGAKVKFHNQVVEIDSTTINRNVATYELVRKMRASYYLWGALLGRFKSAEVATPGGCSFCARPIDQHIKGFEALGAKVTIHNGNMLAVAEQLKGSQIYLDVVSVGATINIMLAAVRAEGFTTIENAAKEPHIVDVANFLNAMGAKVKGAGTDVIRIQGVEKLHGGTYAVIPDQIEAGTLMIAAAVTRGDVIIKNIIPKHMESLTAKLIETGVTVEEGDDAIRIYSDKRPYKANVKTLPYPGFPTDLQPQMTVLLALAEGTSIVTEGVWDSRFQYVEELRHMGANIRVEGRLAIVEGVPALSGAPVNATDLRAGAALVIAGLAASGITEVYGLEHIDRGYEDFEGKLRALGAVIERVKV